MRTLAAFGREGCRHPPRVHMHVCGPSLAARLAQIECPAGHLVAMRGRLQSPKSPDDPQWAPQPTAIKKTPVRNVPAQGQRVGHPAVASAPQQLELVLGEVDAVLLGGLVDAVLVDGLHGLSRELHAHPAVQVVREVLLGLEVDLLLAAGHPVREGDGVGVVRAPAGHLALAPAVRAHHHARHTRSGSHLSPESAGRRARLPRKQWRDEGKHHEDEEGAHLQA
mmetsp:Transcript_243/g.708  ORF Transcript_243/g.708 Transcript_243/m.708 type:complete len:223 (+) Transcript_243:424-1092(+)